MAIFTSVLTYLVPVLSRIFLLWLDHSKDKKEARRRFLAFIDTIRPNVPNKLFRKHYEDIRIIRQELGLSEHEREILTNNLKNYRDAYEKTYSELMKLKGEK